MRRKSFVILLVALCLICLTCVLCACGDKNDPQQAHEHSYTLVEAHDPTCTASGNVLYYTCTCGKFFDSEKREIEESQTVISATGHDKVTTSWESDGISHWHKCNNCDDRLDEARHTVITDNAISATCTALGKTEGSHCEVCSKVLVEQHDVGALGHDYKMTWTSDDNETAQVVLTCQRDNTHVYRCSGTVVTDRTEATCEADGEIRYTVTIEYDNKTYTDTHTQKLDKFNHNYSIPKWTWTEDKSSATLELTCANDANHKISVNNVTVSNEERTNACAIEVVYTATASYNGQTYNDTQIITKDGKHAYGQPTWTWDAQHTKATAHFVCATDPQHTLDVSDDEIAIHIDDSTCTQDGTKTYAASVEVYGQSYETTFDENIPAKGHSYGTNGKCNVCGSIKDLLIFKTLQEGDGDTYSGKVSNATTFFSFLNEVTANSDTSYTVCTDMTCTDTIPSKTAPLNIGDNTFYILAERGNDMKLFTIKIRRRPVYTINFVTSGSAVEQQSVEEDEDIAPVETTKTGYTFEHWTLNGEQIEFPYTAEKGINYTGNYAVTITAVFKANNYTITLEKDGGDLDESEVSVTYDEQYTLPIPTRMGHTFLGWFEGETKFADDKGVPISNRTWIYTEGKTVTAHWKVNDYRLTVNKNISAAGEVTGGGTFTYGNEVTVTATTYLGYEFLGWYNNAGENVYQGETYIFSMGLAQTLTATYQVIPEMTDLKFTSTLSSCEITGVKYNDITEITIPDIVTSISDRAFYNCTGLQTVNWNAKNCTKAGKSEYYIFKECTQLTTLNIGENVQSLPAYAFYGCTGLNDIIIPDSVQTIGEWAFDDCTGLHTVTINAQSIGRSAFLNCIALRTVNIGENVQSIDDYAFSGCTGITQVNYLGIFKGWCEIEFGNSEANPMSVISGKTQLYCNGEIVDLTNLTNLNIPQGTTKIGSCAFCGLKGITSVTIPDSVTSIGDWAFDGCTGLKEITIPDSVTSIDYSAFSGCNFLKSFTVEEGNSVYQSKDGVLYKKEDKSIYLVPSAIEGAVTILDGCTNLTGFSNRTGISEITIPDSVTSIGSNVFSGCTGITKVNYRGNLKGWCEIWFGDVSANPLYSANNNKAGSAKLYLNDEEVTGDVNIPSETSKISEAAFWGLKGITSVTIPDSVQSIGYGAFQNCTGLQTAIINAHAIYSNVFAGCISLKTLSLGEKVENINNAFQNCISLSTVNWNAVDVTMSKGAIFSDCIKLNAVIFGDEVKKIPDSAFNNSSSLCTVTIGKNVTDIGNNAFSNCYKLIEVCNKSTLQIIPGNSSFGYIGYYAKNVYIPLDGDSKLTYRSDGYIIYEDTDVCELIGYNGDSSDLLLPDLGKEYAIHSYAFCNRSDITSVIIPDSVTSIDNLAFYDCTGLQTVNWNAINCANVGKREYDSKTSQYYDYTIFRGCTKLATVIIGKDVQSIPAYAFYNCKGLKEITIPNCVTSIGEYAFSGCTSLQSVTIFDNVQSIGDWAFQDCTGITNVNVDSLKGWCEIEFGNSYANPMTVTSGKSQLYCNGEIVDFTNLNIPQGTTKIGSFVFDEFTGINSVTISDSVQNIGACAFYGCNGLKELTIPASVTSIGNGAFSYCKNLQNVNINAQSISYYAFSYCTGLKTVTIGDGMQSIGDYAFLNCTGLTDIYYVGSSTQWKQIKKGHNWNVDDSSYPNYYTISYQMHYNSTGPEDESAASNIADMPSQPVLIVCDRLDLWVKQNEIQY